MNYSVDVLSLLQMTNKLKLNSFLLIKFHYNRIHRALFIFCPKDILIEEDNFAKNHTSMDCFSETFRAKDICPRMKGRVHFARNIFARTFYNIQYLCIRLIYPSH